MDKITRIIPMRGFGEINFRELWEYRELLWVLIERDIKVRYKQTVIGGLWAVVQPLLTMIVFTIFFSRLSGALSGNTPYPLFAYSGLILWTYFTNAISGASASMIDNTYLISKIYLPRVFIPLTSTITPGLDYWLTSGLLFGFAFYYQMPIRLGWIFLPLAWSMTWILASGIGFWLSSLNVKYRDIRHALPFFIQLLIFVTPVIYPLNTVGKYRWLIKINPMSGLIEWHRNLILGAPIDWGLVIYSVGASLGLFFTGLIYFKSVERYFTDKL